MQKILVLNLFCTPAIFICITCAFSSSLQNGNGTTISVEKVVEPGIYIIGGENREFFGYSRKFQKIDPENNATNSVILDTKYAGRSNAGLLWNGHFVFAITGYSQFSKYKGIALYNPVENIVTDYKPDSVSEFIQYTTVVNETKFVLCGHSYDIKFQYSQCTIFDMRHNTKKTVVFNDTKRSGCILDSGDGVHAFYIGGWSRSIIKMNTKDGTHKIIASMPDSIFQSSPGTGQGCAILGNQIVICGGIEWNGTKTTVTNRCLTFSLEDMQFATHPAMVKNRTFFHLANWKGKLYAIGGKDDEEQYLSSIEIFDGQKWSLHPELKLEQGLAHFGIIVVDEPKSIIVKAEDNVNFFGTTECALPNIDPVTQEMEIIDSIAVVWCTGKYHYFHDKSNVVEMECIDGNWEPSFEQYQTCSHL